MIGAYPCISTFMCNSTGCRKEEHRYKPTRLDWVGLDYIRLKAEESLLCLAFISLVLYLIKCVKSVRKHAVYCILLLNNLVLGAATLYQVQEGGKPVQAC